MERRTALAADEKIYGEQNKQKNAAGLKGLKLKIYYWTKQLEQPDARTKHSNTFNANVGEWRELDAKRFSKLGIIMIPNADGLLGAKPMQSNRTDERGKEKNELHSMMTEQQISNPNFEGESEIMVSVEWMDFGCWPDPFGVIVEGDFKLQEERPLLARARSLARKFF